MQLPETDTSKAADLKFDVTPYTFFTASSPAANAFSYSGAYTRFQIDGEIFERGAGTGQNLSYQDRRNKLAQLLVGLKYDTSFTVKLRAGEYEETVSLLTLASTSDRNGSTWTRDVRHNALDFPWFQITSTTATVVPSIAPRVRVSQVMSSGAAAAALKAALKAVETLSPQSSVITTLGGATAKSRADAVDEIISRLFATQVDEGQKSDAEVKWWQVGAGAKVTLSILKDPSKPGGETALVGTWTIGFAPPRVSLFSDYRVCGTEGDGFCKPTFKAAAVEAYKSFPQVVLSFAIKPQLSIQKWVEQTNWWSATRDRFVGDRDNDLGVANELCAKSTVALSEIGLNVVDSDLVTWAMLQMAPRPLKLSKTFQYSEAPECKSVYDRVTGVKDYDKR